MEQTPGPFEPVSCQPALYCVIDSQSGNAYWTFATLTGKVTVSFVILAKLDRTVRFYLDSDGVGCTGTCPPSVYLLPATVTADMSYTSSGQIVAGTTLHVTVSGAANAGPIQGDLHVDLPGGVLAPTNLPAGAVYSPPPAHYIDNVVTLNQSFGYSFDVVIATHVSTLPFSVWFFPSSYAISVPATRTIAVGPDANAPTTSAPKQTLVTGSGFVSGGVPIRLTWSGSDDFSGVERYELGESQDGRAWVTISSSLPTPATWRYVAANHTYRFRVRAIDHAQNVGAWRFGPTFRLGGYSESSTSIRYAGTWGLSYSSLFWGGKAKNASARGASAAFTATGSVLAWVSLRGPTRGKAYVYVDGSLVATVDLYASTTQAMRLVWTKQWSTSATRTVMVRVQGTSGRPRVDLDGFLVIR